MAEYFLDSSCALRDKFEDHAAKVFEAIVSGDTLYLGDAERDTRFARTMLNALGIKPVNILPATRMKGG